MQRIATFITRGETGNIEERIGIALYASPDDATEICRLKMLYPCKIISYVKEDEISRLNPSEIFSPVPYGKELVVDQVTVCGTYPAILESNSILHSKYVTYCHDLAKKVVREETKLAIISDGTLITVAEILTRDIISESPIVWVANPVALSVCDDNLFNTVLHAAADTTPNYTNVLWASSDMVEELDCNNEDHVELVRIYNTVQTNKQNFDPNLDVRFH
jgi:hypothetical protein